MASSRVGGGRVADGGANPVAEKQAYLEKASHVTDESLASTRRMVGMIEQSKESAVGTMVQLDEQVLPSAEARECATGSHFPVVAMLGRLLASQGINLESLATSQIGEIL